jgi:pimeloyl-ACP methyl ester carboxylesterase
VANDWSSQAKGAGHYADVNGLHMYYEVHADAGNTGRPLVLLHGGLGSGEMFGPLVPGLAAGRVLYLPDLQGHGRTADIDRPITVEAMADDIAALINHLGLKRPDVMGYSLGGGVAMLTAIRHPEVVGRLVTVSVHIRRNAMFPEMFEQQAQVGPAAAEFMKETPMYQLYQRVAPRPEDFPQLLGKIGGSMTMDFDFTEEVRALKMPVLYVTADADMFPPSHAAEVFSLLGGGQRDGGWQGEGRGQNQLAIIPGTTHYSIFMSPVLLAAVRPFLDAPFP